MGRRRKRLERVKRHEDRERDLVGGSRVCLSELYLKNKINNIRVAKIGEFVSGGENKTKQGSHKGRVEYTFIGLECHLEVKM
jgi:hypothetical protein